MNSMSKNMHFLNDIWIIYFHDPYKTDWTIESYIKLTKPISTIEDFLNNWIYLLKNIEKGIFFFMREHVFPCWDCPENINGGILSIKVLKDDLTDFLKILVYQLIGEILLKNEYKEFTHCINGISTSPKKHFCIVKIWVSDSKLYDKKFFDIPLQYHGDILYKSNRDNITNENIRLMNILNNKIQ